jgi:prophage regulatory protein
VTQVKTKMDSTMNAPRKFLRLPAVIDQVGLKRATIYKRRKSGTFPAPVQLGPQAVAWEEAAIAKWQASLETGVKKALV